MDPRQPGRINRFEVMPQAPTKGQQSLTGQDIPASLNVLAAASMLLGAAGMATRAKSLAWLALLACMSAGANLRRQHDGDARAAVGAFMYVGTERLIACGRKQTMDQAREGLAHAHALPYARVCAHVQVLGHGAALDLFLGTTSTRGGLALFVPASCICINERGKERKRKSKRVRSSGLLDPFLLFASHSDTKTNKSDSLTPLRSRSHPPHPATPSSLSLSSSPPLRFLQNTVE